MNTPDFDELKRQRRMGRRMLTVYKALEPTVKLGMEGLNISCRAGCASCCYLLTLVSLPEAVAVAEYILSNVERRRLIPELSRKFWEQAQAIEQGGFEKIRTAYFKKKLPCAFLDPETKLCTIYEVRPSSCRYHFVVSDPSLCSPDVDAEIGRVDTAEAANVCLSEANRVSKQMKLPLYVAPLPIAMLWAFKLLIEGRAAFDAALKDDNLGVLNLAGWTELLRRDEWGSEKASTTETTMDGSV